MIQNNTQVLIVTHSTKSIQEQGVSDPLFYPGAPNTQLLAQVFDNLAGMAGLTDVVVVIDHKVDCPVSTLYLENLRTFCQERSARLVVSPATLLMGNQLSATAAFLRGIRAIEAEQVLFFEHDHLFLRALDWAVIERAFASGVALLRFNEFANQSRPDSREILSPLPGCEGVCRTNYYCNKPFLARTDYCLRLFELAEQAVPTWNGIFGGFVEGPIGRQMMADEFNLEPDEFLRRYPMAVYGAMGEPALIEHFGVFPGRRARWTKRIKAWLGRAS